MIPASDGVAVRAERVSRHYQMGSALIRAVDDVTLKSVPESSWRYWKFRFGEVDALEPDGRPGSPDLRDHFCARPQSV